MMQSVISYLVHAQFCPCTIYTSIKQIALSFSLNGQRYLQYFNPACLKHNSKHSNCLAVKNYQIRDVISMCNALPALQAPYCLVQSFSFSIKINCYFSSSTSFQHRGTSAIKPHHRPAHFCYNLCMVGKGFNSVQ